MHGLRQIEVLPPRSYEVDVGAVCNPALACSLRLDALRTIFECFNLCIDVST